MTMTDKKVAELKDTITTFADACYCLKKENDNLRKEMADLKATLECDSRTIVLMNNDLRKENADLKNTVERLYGGKVKFELDPDSLKKKKADLIKENAGLKEAAKRLREGGVVFEFMLPRHTTHYNWT